MSKDKKWQPDDSRQKTSGKSRRPERNKPITVAQASPIEGTTGTVTKEKEPEKPSHSSFGTFRELIESVAIAFILAFLFRTFEAEAFVIPTGSMATTLMGRHKDVTCPQCGYPYTVSASEEVDSLTGEVTHQGHVYEATCPQCRFPQTVNDDTSFNGDRILVSKFDYQLDKPNRWDVTVFMYPDDAKTNFIKRLVGLPNETVKISHGDLLVKKDGEPDFEIARKPPKKFLAMSRVVYDNDYGLPKTLQDNGWPRRWRSPDVTAAWETSDDYRSFSTNGTTVDDVVLRYYHYLPDSEAWKRNQFQTRSAAPRTILPQLITDDCAYNSGVSRQSLGMGLNGLGLHWVGDLGIECQLDVRKASGSIVFELTEGGRKMLCEIDLSDGTARLTIPGETFLATAKTSISTPGDFQIRFVNADDELRLWVNDEVIPFDKPTTFGPLGNQVPTEADLAPVAIVSRQADVTVSHLRVLRDIYYIADEMKDSTGQHFGVITDFKNFYSVFARPTENDVRNFYQSPELWPKAFSDRSMREVEFPLKEKQYFMLGDNSPQSKDGRLWGYPEYYVDESLLKGKALYIYWPHSWDKVEIGNFEIPFPFFPNYERMQLVR